MLSIGLTEKVSANISDKTKRRLGQLAYITEAFKWARRHNPYRYEISTPSRSKPLTGFSHQIVVYNSDVNQQLKIAPDHDLHKPTLKVVIYGADKRISRLLWGFLVHILTLGRFRPSIKTLETDALTIKTTPVRSLGYDGEVENTSPADIKLIKKAASIIS